MYMCLSFFLSLFPSQVIMYIICVHASTYRQEHIYMYMYVIRVHASTYGLVHKIHVHNTHTSTCRYVLILIDIGTCVYFIYHLNLY